MSSKEVRVAGCTAASPQQVWQLAGEFCAHWHPAIARMEQQRDSQGHIIRAFTLHGEDKLYRERLSWYSDSERSMAYTHIEGIEGAQHYQAGLAVKPADDGGSEIVLTANLRAADPRADEIADGSKAIFEQTISTIRQLTAQGGEPHRADAAVSDCREQTATQIHTHRLGSSPRLAVSQAGDSSDTLCLFLHGIGGNRHNWEQQLAAVAPYCMAAALDLRGYGDSDLGPGQTTVHDYCADILQVAETFKASKLILCGLSYGAWIATSFAMRHPQRLAALVLSGGCTGMSEASDAERKAFLQSRQIPLDQGRTPADFAPDVVSVIAGPAVSDSVRAELMTSMQAIPAQTYADALHCFTHPGEQFDFSRITMPVLLMTGEYDRLAPAAEIKTVAQRIHTSSPIPDVRFECLADAGHVCNLEASTEYNTILIELIQRVLP